MRRFSAILRFSSFLFPSAAFITRRQGKVAECLFPTLEFHLNTGHTLIVHRSFIQSAQTHAQFSTQRDDVISTRILALSTPDSARPPDHALVLCPPTASSAQLSSSARHEPPLHTRNTRKSTMNTRTQTQHNAMKMTTETYQRKQKDTQQTRTEHKQGLLF